MPGNWHAWFGRGTLEKGRKGTSPASYLTIWDTDFGAGFIKICAYFPYP